MGLCYVLSQQNQETDLGCDAALRETETLLQTLLCPWQFKTF